jgi:hypothetical protein
VNKEIEALETLIRAFEEPGSCFVLGAGASTPIVPLAAELGIHVRKRLLAVGVFPAIPIPRDAIADRILGPPRSSVPANHGESDVQEELIARHLSPAAVRAAAVAILRPEAPICAPAQYQVFELSKYPLSLINFNNDGLANRFCGRHAVINVHGTSLSVEERIKHGWENWIDALQYCGDRGGIEIPGLLLPQREPDEIGNTAQYICAQRSLQAARRLVLLGYSFGDMDDVVAYKLIMSVIKSRRVPTVVAKPNATDLAIQISADSECKMVSALSVYWDKLANAMIASVWQPRYKTCEHTRLCSRCITYFYSAFLDQVAGSKYWRLLASHSAKLGTLR